MRIYAQAALIFGGLVAGLFHARRVEFWLLVPGMGWYVFDLMRRDSGLLPPQPRPPRRRR